MFGVMGSMEQDQLFQQAEDAQQTARRLVQEAREQARKAREQLSRVKRSDQPLLWFSSDDE